MMALVLLLRQLLDIDILTSLDAMTYVHTYH